MPTSYLRGIFGRSPIKPLHDHMSKVVECANELTLFAQAVVEGDWDKAETVRHTIIKLEHEADDMKREFRLHMPNSLFMPVSRVDLLNLLQAQDSIANKVKDISGLMSGRQMVLPGALHGPFLRQIQRSIDATEQAHNSVIQLGELFESGFHGAEAKLVDSMIVELDRIESDTDTIQVEMRDILYPLENELAPVDVIFIYKAIEWVGQIADICHGVGNALQQLLAR